LRRFNRWVLGVLQSDFSIKTRTRKWRGAKATSSIPIQSDPFECTEDTKRWVEQLIGPIQQGGLVSRLRRWISRNKAERGDVRS
ncbi:MAG: serine/threonine protein kinase, partial [Paenibacillus sp.]